MEKDTEPYRMQLGGILADFEVDHNEEKAVEALFKEIDIKRQEWERKAEQKGRDMAVEHITHEMMEGKIRDAFEEYFPKDEEATMGIRQSKSNRAGALGLYGEFHLVLKEARAIKNEIPH